MDPANAKIPLPKFLRCLTSNNIPVPKAMAIAGKIYREYNTPNMLSHISDIKLKAAGIELEEDRKLVLAALRKAGYALILPNPLSNSKKAAVDEQKISFSAMASSSRLNSVQAMVRTTPMKRKRKKVEDVNEFLPDGPVDEAAHLGNLDFYEELEESVLTLKYIIINRAPLMTAWATLVAECMGFQREEALSIASVYTELNAVSKGTYLGLYKRDSGRGLEASSTESQPFVELMGRRVPLYRTQTGHWRALLNDIPILPSMAFSYISRSFRQTTPYIMGALRLLAESYPPHELNKNAWSLYTEFRPAAGGWGQRSEVRCQAILALRKKKGIERVQSKTQPSSSVLKREQESSTDQYPYGEEPLPKKSRGLTLEEYEASLEQDTTFDGVDLGILDSAL